MEAVVVEKTIGPGVERSRRRRSVVPPRLLMLLRLPLLQSVDGLESARPVGLSPEEKQEGVVDG